jgi:hypothetical protein
VRARARGTVHPCACDLAVARNFEQTAKLASVVEVDELFERNLRVGVRAREHDCVRACLCSHACAHLDVVDDFLLPPMQPAREQPEVLRVNMLEHFLHLRCNLLLCDPTGCDALHCAGNAWARTTSVWPGWSRPRRCASSSTPRRWSIR